MAVLILILSALGSPRVEDEPTRTVADTEALREALARVRPGETIRIAPGRYRGGFSARRLRGAPGQPIILRGADPKHPPVIEGGGAGFQFSEVAHLELHDLIVSGATGNGINIDDGGTLDAPSHHIVIRGVVVRDIGPNGNHDGIKLSGVNDFRVENCVLERWGGGGSGIDMVGCRRGLIVGSTFRHGDTTGDNGVQAKGGSSAVVVRGCRFEHAGQRAVNLGGSTGLAFFRTKAPNCEAKDITVEDCVFIGSAAPLAFVGVDGAVVRRNTIYRPKRWAFRILQENRAPGFVPCRNGRFVQNLIVYRSDEMAMPINIGDATDPKSFSLAENAWYCLDAPGRGPLRLPIPEADGRHGVDPRFRDAERGDLRLSPDSPIRSAGARDGALAP